MRHVRRRKKRFICSHQDQITYATESRTVALLLLVDILHDFVALGLTAHYFLLCVFRVLEHLSLPGHSVKNEMRIGTRERQETDTVAGQGLEMKTAARWLR